MRCLLPTGVVLLGLSMFATPARPCSRVLWNDNGRCVLVGRNMDWFEDLKSNLWVLARGMKRDGLAAKNPLTWTSKNGDGTFQISKSGRPLCATRSSRRIAAWGRMVSVVMRPCGTQKP